MKSALKFSRITAAVVAVVFLAVSCGNPSDGRFVNLPPPGGGILQLAYFHVDADGEFTETDSGRTVIIADGETGVMFYSDDTASGSQHVGFSFGDKTIVFFFEAYQNFPSRIAFSDSEESLNGFFTPYDPIAQTFGLTIERDGERDTLSNIALSRDIFAHYEDGAELTPSQNLRMRNLYIAMWIYTSLAEAIASDDALQASRIMGRIASDDIFQPSLIFGGISIRNTVRSFVSDPVVSRVILLGGLGASVITGNLWAIPLFLAGYTVLNHAANGGFLDPTRTTMSVAASSGGGTPPPPPPPTALTGNVSITGTPQVGHTLTTNTNLLFGSGALSFQWQRGTTPIPGATGRTYTLQSADVGQSIRVVVTSSGNSGSVTSPAIGPVTAPPPPPILISLDAPSVHTFASLRYGYAAGSLQALTVRVSNTGSQPTGSLTVALSGSGSFALSSSTVPSIPAGGSATFTVIPNTGLAVGTHAANVTVSGGANIQASSFGVFFTVADAPTFGISLNAPETHIFPALFPGYAAGSRQELTVRVTNTGNQPTGALNAALSGANAGSFTLTPSSIPSIPAGGSATFTVIPNNGLAIGAYAATVTVSGGANIQPSSFGVSLAVTEEPTFGISLDTPANHVFAPLSPGYTAGDRQNLTVTVTNTGNQPTGALNVALSGNNAGSFALTPTTIPSIPVGGSATFTVIPNNGLVIGTYTATVTVSGGAYIQVRSFGISFAVNAPLYGLIFQRIPFPAFPLVSGYMVTGRTETGGAINIPATHNGLQVTSIGDRAFENNNLTSVTIPSSVTSIGFSAFANNSLTSVTIPSSVIVIEQAAFTNNSLTSVTIPSSVISIGGWAFSGNSLTSVTIPSSVTSIRWRTFYNNHLTSVTIPSSVTRIEEAVFANNNLTSVTIPNSVTSIGSSAFENNSLTSVTIPSSVTSIGFSAFANNSLTSVTIPFVNLNASEWAWGNWRIGIPDTVNWIFSP